MKGLLGNIVSFWRRLYLSNRLFMLFGAVVLLFLFSFSLPWLFLVAQVALGVALVFVLVDIFVMFTNQFQLSGERHITKICSLGDENPVRLDIVNNSAIGLNVTVIDELPIQFQERKFSLRIKVEAGTKESLHYQLLPKERGVYKFGKLNLYARSFIGLVERRVSLPIEQEVAVYPSVLQMRKFELKTFTRIATQTGIKRTRRIGHSYEFEQIKNYVRGDDFRSINWKATSRRGDLMVNQYEDEKSQQVYCVIDKGRAMKMPFNNLSLLDHSINTCLVISNIILRKSDKVGLLTFSDKIGTLVKTDRGGSQLRRIMEALYWQRESQKESNYELLYTGVRNMIKGRSLLFLFTNFESPYAMERILPLLRSMNRMHLLVVIFFENTELADLSQEGANDVQGVYLQTIARKLVTEKQQIVQELNRYGIQTILTKPEELSMNTINKYLELKSRGLI